jgi:pyruvate dehydrogenase (quinone)
VDRVTLFGGAGCAGAQEEVLQPANAVQAPIACSFRGKEFLDSKNLYAVGMTGC